MPDKKNPKIQEELAKYGIKTECFQTFYETLRKGSFPEKTDDFPAKQYDLILRYLISKQVIDPDLTINKKELKIFGTQLDLEQLLEKIKTESRKIEIGIPRSSGGIAPCRHSGHLGSSGGIAPCSGGPFGDED